MVKRQETDQNQKELEKLKESIEKLNNSLSPFSGSSSEILSNDLAQIESAFEYVELFVLILLHWANRFFLRFEEVLREWNQGSRKFSVAASFTG
jgi:hypothetical protein